MLSERFAWSENIDRWCTSVSSHDQHFTYAENIYGADCLIPRLEFQWKTTRMPIVLDLWREIGQAPALSTAPWTTVMTWNAFKGRLFYQGVEYKSKGSEFEKLMEMPQRVPIPLKVAVGGMKAPIDRLTARGWQVVDGPTTSLTPQQYQDFITASRGELSPAKHVYVAMRSGWFSCRSACYLASSRPVVVQDTGFSRILPTGEGILSFTTLEEAVSAIQQAEVDYARHAKVALAIAGEYFDADKVLTQMIDKIHYDDQNI